MNYYSIAYICIGLYFSIGLILLLIVKSPVSRALKKTMSDVRFQYLNQNKLITFFHISCFVVTLLFYPLIGYENFQKQRAAKLWHRKRKSFQRPWDSSPSPYTKKVSVLEAEKNHMEILDNKKVPFAGNDDRWKAMISKMQDGDELWEYTSPAEMWEILAGQDGIVLVRDGKVIDDLLLVMN